MPTRMQSIEPDKATGATKEALDKVNQKYGNVSNIFKMMGNSPAAVNAFMAMSSELAKGVLTPQTAKKIAITCAEVNVSEYSLSAHYALAKKLGMSEAELEEARLEKSKDPKENAILGLARSLITNRAELSDNVWQQYRDAGLTDAEITETVAHVALNIFTNYFNKIAQPELDYPRVKTAFPV